MAELQLRRGFEVKRSGHVACFGCPMLDMVARVDIAFLRKHGLEADSNTMVIDKKTDVFEDVEKLPVTCVVGGAAQNTARVCQWALQSVAKTTDMGPESVLQRCVSIGCVGDDSNGRFLASETPKDGVAVEYAIDKKLSTGVCVVMVTGNHRTLVSNYGAWMNYPGEHLESIWGKVVLNSSMLYLSGYFVQSCNNAARCLANHVSTNDSQAVLSVNLSSVYVCQESHATVVDIIECAAFVFGNYKEALALAKACDFWDDGDGIDTLCRKLCLLHKQPNGLMSVTVDEAVTGNSPGADTLMRTVVLTQGREAVIHGQRWLGGRVELERFPVEPLDGVVDTNGAGDAFVAGYLCGVVCTQSYQQCVHLAMQCARCIVKETGCTVPKYDLPVCQL